jgi:hypothetical protein
LVGLPLKDASTMWALATRASSVIRHIVANRGELQIHAGPHKTGSTSLQRSLRETGMLYPSRRGDFRSRDSFDQALRGAHRNVQILSSEHLLGEVADLYSSAPDRLTQISACGFRSRVFVYLRPHLEWHTSIVSQLIQQGSFEFVDRYFEQLPQKRYVSLRSFCEDLLDASSSSLRVEIRVSEDVVADFARRVSVPLRGRSGINASFSPVALASLRKLSESAYAPHSVLRSALRGYAQESRGVFSILTSSQQNFLKNMRADWMDTLKLVSNYEDKSVIDSLGGYDREVLPSVYENFSNKDRVDATRHVDKWLMENR